jgi:hypothetical protein
MLPLHRRFGKLENVAAVHPCGLEHDPEKWEPVFPRDKRQGRCAAIMLKQEDEQRA